MINLKKNNPINDVPTDTIDYLDPNLNPTDQDYFPFLILVTTKGNTFTRQEF